MPSRTEVLSAFISISVNGEQTEIPAGQCVPELLDFLSIPADRVAIEIDKSIVRKRDWQQTLVQPGAQIEIVEFVGGG